MHDKVKRFACSMAAILLTDIMLVACCSVVDVVRENIKKAEKRREVMEKCRNRY